MANLPESLFVDPKGKGPLIPSYTRVGPNPTAIDGQSATVEQLILLLREPQYREDALTLLNKKRATCEDLALQLWNSFNTAFILLQEVLSAYKLLSPPKITMRDSTRVCNALALLQCLASHPDTRMDFIQAKIPVYLYPFIRTTEKQKPSEFLRLTSLGVIGALVKVEDPNTPQVVHFLLETEVFPLCLLCMEVGSELTQTVATFIVSKILMQKDGIHYCSSFAERFFSVGCLLAVMVDKFPGKPPKQLMKHILSCYLSLSNMARACDALRHCFPPRLMDPSFIRVACEDSLIKQMLEQLIFNVSTRAGRWSGTRTIQGGTRVIDQTLAARHNRVLS